jgi:SUKH superfamily protein
MSMDDLDRALELVREHEDAADFVGPRGELLAAAEEALRHPLPPTYRRFVGELGAGDLAGVELYGVIDADFESSGVPDAIWFTLTERRENDLPDGLVLVMQYIDGFYACLDTRGMAPGTEAPIVAWFSGEPVERLADDFGAFMREQLEQALSDDVTT